MRVNKIKKIAVIFGIFVGSLLFNSTAAAKPYQETQANEGGHVPPYYGVEPRTDLQCRQTAPRIKTTDETKEILKEILSGINMGQVCGHMNVFHCQDFARLFVAKCNERGIACDLIEFMCASSKSGWKDVQFQGHAMGMVFFPTPAPGQWYIVEPQMHPYAAHWPAIYQTMGDCRPTSKEICTAMEGIGLIGRGECMRCLQGPSYVYSVHDPRYCQEKTFDKRYMEDPITRLCDLYQLHLGDYCNQCCDSESTKRDFEWGTDEWAKSCKDACSKRYDEYVKECGWKPEDFGLPPGVWVPPRDWFNWKGFVAPPIGLRWWLGQNGRQPQDGMAATSETLSLESVPSAIQSPGPVDGAVSAQPPQGSVESGSGSSVGADSLAQTSSGPTGEGPYNLGNREQWGVDSQATNPDPIS